MKIYRVSYISFHIFRKNNDRELQIIKTGSSPQFNPLKMFYRPIYLSAKLIRGGSNLEGFILHAR